MRIGKCCAPGEVSGERRYPELEEAARLFRALGDETRLAILKQLVEQGEVCACDFLACCALAQPTVSHHLKVLREAGLVNATKRGLWVHYTLNSQKLEALRALVLRLSSLFGDGDTSSGRLAMSPAASGK